MNRLVQFFRKFQEYATGPSRRERQFASEVARSQDQLKACQEKLAQAEESARISSITAQNALSRAQALEFANEQLRNELSATLTSMADRLERAYAGFGNWAALGGAASRRPPFPWVPVGDMPAVPTSAAMEAGSTGRLSPRAYTNRLTQETMEKLGRGNAKSSPIEDLRELEQKMATGELFADSEGNIRESQTFDKVGTA